MGAPHREQPNAGLIEKFRFLYATQSRFFDCNSGKGGGGEYVKLGQLLTRITVPFLKSELFRSTFKESHLTPDANLARLAISGHSAGNHIAVRLASLFMISPRAHKPPPVPG